MKKRLLSILLALCIFFAFSTIAFADAQPDDNGDYTPGNGTNGDGSGNGAGDGNGDVGVISPGTDFAARAVILIEASTGRVLYEYNADEAMLPASVTKIMTVLLVMEALANDAFTLECIVTVSEFAASMGGSQIFLEPNERMSVYDLLKSVIIASANDAAVALAELVSGNYETFITKMNTRAAELGMTNTTFANSTGLEGDGNSVNMTSARDIAIMSAALVEYEKVLEIAVVWMDTIRNGEFGLTNTNRLVRFYNGINGLKTGFTARAGYCISATARRDGMQLIAVIMGSETRDSRNEAARKLLDYGFSNYSLASFAEGNIEDIPVRAGVSNSVTLTRQSFSIVLSRGENLRVEERIELPEFLSAPVQAGDVVGRVVYILDGNEIGISEIIAAETVERIGFFRLFGRMIQHFFLV